MAGEIKIDLLEITELASAATSAAATLDPQSEAAQWAALVGRLGLITTAVIRRSREAGVDLEGLEVESFADLVQRKLEARR
jgi:hypothetical protein